MQDLVQHAAGPWATPRTLLQVAVALAGRKTPTHLMTTEELYRQLLHPTLTIDHEEDHHGHA